MVMQKTKIKVKELEYEMLHEEINENGDVILKEKVGK